MPSARINIFRQNLINDGATPVKMAITNLTEGELKRGVSNLLRASDSYIEKNILKKGEKGVVAFCIYDTPKKIPTSRNVTFSHFINSKDYSYKILDTNDLDENSTSYYDSTIDIGQYLKYKGNPNNLFKQKEQIQKEVEEEKDIPEIIEKENEKTVEEIAGEEKKEEVLQDTDIQEEEKESKFVCEVEGCGKEYATKKGYKNHMKKVHGIEV